ncbi:uncharacterized protein LOC116407741 [Xenopus tropicalis]|uniref:Uncharacterized protein LOC116407741 n=1 Tax=Xenopus tropicalis TaxID=8364 RepID=A0A8J1IVA6_XENTR|nr:uncharacterized protein LOC116407741 [Xenopus tropicalis]
MAAGRRVLVGIFSRESEESYKWLINILISFKEVDVRPVLISNSRCLTEDISKCDVAILYHSQNRGRINITDVTDSLYDEELKLLSKWLGKENVMVVVDDLTDINQQLKNRILQHQPSIGELANELFLFSVNEKSSEALMSDDFRENKMKEMENIIKEKRKKKAPVHSFVPIGNLMPENSRINITGFLKKHAILISGLTVIFLVVVIVISRNRYTEHLKPTAGYPTASNMSTPWHPETITSSLPLNNSLHPTNLTFYSVDTKSEPGNGTQESPTSTFQANNGTHSPGRVSTNGSDFET